MERRQPLHRKTPLKRGTGLPRRTQPRRWSRLNPVSEKRKALNARRYDVLERLRRERPWCEACERILRKTGWYMGEPSRCRYKHHADDAHEKLTRARGGSILDPENIVMVCRWAHDWIHQHPAASTNLGLLIPSGEGDDRARD